MKRLNKLVIGLLLALVVISGASLAYAASEGRGPGGARGGAGGEVTAVGDSSLTVENRNGESITVNVTDETVVNLVETGGQGSLSDIEVGDNVRVRGSRNDDGSVDARGIALLPDGDSVGGRVTSVDGSTITVENRDSSATIIVSDSTTFRNQDETLSLSDVTEDAHVRAFGDLQGDDSLSAQLVLIGHGQGPKDGSSQDGDRQGPRPNRGGGN